MRRKIAGVCLIFILFMRYRGLSYYIRYTSDSQDFNVLVLSMYVLKRLEFYLTGSEFNVCGGGGGHKRTL